MFCLACRETGVVSVRAHSRVSGSSQLSHTPLCTPDHWCLCPGFHQHGYLGCPPGDPHMEGIVTADLGVCQTPALLISFHKGGLLVRQDVTDDHGGAADECRLKEEGGSQVLSQLCLHLSHYHRGTRCSGSTRITTEVGRVKHSKARLGALQRCDG